MNISWVGGSIRAHTKISKKHSSVIYVYSCVPSRWTYLRLVRPMSRAEIVIQNPKPNATHKRAPSSCTYFVIIILSPSLTAHSHTHTHSCAPSHRSPESIFYFHLFFVYYLFLVFILSRLLAAIIIHLAVGSHSYCIHHSLCLSSLARTHIHTLMHSYIRKCWHCCGATRARARRFAHSHSYSCTNTVPSGRVLGKLQFSARTTVQKQRANERKMEKRRRCVK